MRVQVLVNRAAGVKAGQAEREAAAIRRGLQERGIDADVREVPPERFREAAREAAREEGDALVVGGGDGTVSAGASAVVGTGRALGILPLGTLNHFARDLRIPLDLPGALDVVAAGNVRGVDVGQAGDRLFVNNASMGLYPRAVEDRERIRASEDVGRWRAMARAMVGAARNRPLLRVTLRMMDGSVRLTTPLVFIGNNRYEMRLFAMGRRQAVDAGELWLYVAKDGGHLGLLGLATRALLGRLDQSHDFLGLSVTEVEVEDRRRVSRVAFDGEVCEVPSPLVYRVRPRALRVLAPPDGPG
ncbi:MAG TPA: diacylglycerol kinase family protein [Vicinamibacteria bacterium]|nr:diacylglycerol kinase family protein [Vicinamibacteria bacterium]